MRVEGRVNKEPGGTDMRGEAIGRGGDGGRGGGTGFGEGVINRFFLLCNIVECFFFFFFYIIYAFPPIRYDALPTSLRPTSPN